MPIYEFECIPNHHRFEKMRSLGETSLPACDVCGGPVRKVYSPAGIIFKGSGWYKTDSRKPESSEGSPSAKDASKIEGKAESKADGKSEPKSESKGDGKSEPKSEGKTSSPASSKEGPAGTGSSGSSGSGSPSKSEK